MTKKGAWKSFRSVNGSTIGSLARKSFVCTKCATLHVDVVPVQCGCGNIQFDRFDSRGEARRWRELLLLQRGGVISNLRRQVTYPLMTVGRQGLATKFAAYVADYVYTENGLEIIEDHKSAGIMDPVAKLKLRCMEAMGLTVKLTT